MCYSFLRILINGFGEFVAFFLSQGWTHYKYCQIFGHLKAEHPEIHQQRNWCHYTGLHGGNLDCFIMSSNTKAFIASGISCLKSKKYFHVPIMHLHIRVKYIYCLYIKKSVKNNNKKQTKLYVVKVLSSICKRNSEASFAVQSEGIQFSNSSNFLVMTTQHKLLIEMEIN